MTQSLFGTDGIRGTANQTPMTPEIAFRCGRAVGSFFGRVHADSCSSSQLPCVVIGKDTRRSGSMLESALAAGLNSIGIDATLLGVLPTPGVALLTRQLGACAGVMISASHNSAADNGIKIFQSTGYKLEDAQEQEIEKLILTLGLDDDRPTGMALGIAKQFSDAIGRYGAMLRASVPGLSLQGVRIAVDAANGAAFAVTPSLLKELGAQVMLFHATPNGMNINDGCGSTHGEELRRITLASQAHLGLAHDGDADRLLLCDEQGNLVDGDEILAMTALDALQKGKLAHKTLVTTTMSNFGLDECLQAAGGRVLRTSVGDRHVMEAMLQGNFNIGGEQSGHLIFRDYNTTGDALIAALQVLQIMMTTQKPLSQLRACLKKYPQAQRHLHVSRKPPLESLKATQALIGEIEKKIEGKGRILLRYSGTEPLLRLLIEGRDEIFIDQQCDRIVEALSQEFSLVT